MRPTLFRGLLALAAICLPPALKAAPVQFDLRADRPVIAQGKAQDVVLRLNLHADPIATQRKVPLNLCLVLDRSGSMEGGKIARLREAAAQAVGRLGSDDILSIVTFDSDVRVLLPATRLRDRSAALRAIESISAEGSTALYGGVVEGLAQVKKYRGPKVISRIILISDGLANVGPQTPEALAVVGREAGSLGVPVTTFGLGLDYGEDLMSRLAASSDGNHAFIPNEGGLQAFFDKEMGEALSVAARDLVVEITLGHGVHYKGSLDRDVEVDGDKLHWRLNQLPGGVDKRLMLEVTAPALKSGQSQPLASASLVYADVDGALQPGLSSKAEVRGDSSVKADAAVDSAVAGEAVEARANQSRAKAIELKDEGKDKEAADVLYESAASLKGAGMPAAAAAYESEAGGMAAPKEEWNAQRKSMKAEEHKERTQQSY